MYNFWGHIFLFRKNTWIKDSSALCHIMNDDSSLFEVININKLIQGSSGIMPATKKANFMSTSEKLMTLNKSTLYGLWSFPQGNRWIKTHYNWVAIVKFLQEVSDKRAQSATAPHKKNINNLHVELGHPSESITHPPLKPSVSKSLVPSNHVKIAHGSKPNNKQCAKKMLLDQKLRERVFSST